MALIESDTPVGAGLILHPSVGIVADPTYITPRQKVAAISKVAYLEHSLFDGSQAKRCLNQDDAEALVSQINELRRVLGWLEVDLHGHWLWAPAPN
jgi:hypothetical protein